MDDHKQDGHGGYDDSNNKNMAITTAVAMRGGQDS